MTTCPSVSALRRCFAAALAFSLAVQIATAIPAFPGAEGFGINATGARGGTVFHVTNLNDSGPGSFRDAVSVSGRTVVFDVGGIITLTSLITMKSDLTIAGQTAPGGGITLYGDRLSYSGANNTITRYLRVREGVNGDSGTDAITIATGDTMMFDHVSASWGRDETFSASGTPSNISMQDCIIGQGLLLHSAGSLIQTGGGVSIFRCLYIDNWMRNPKIKGVNDYENNVVYNWGAGGGYIPAGDSAGQTFANMIGNVFIAGPSTGAQGPFSSGNGNYHLYQTNNLQDLNLDGVFNGSPVSPASFPTLDLVATPFTYPSPATLLTPEQAYAHIVSFAGASLHRDHADNYMIAELTSLGKNGAQIFNESEIGGVGTVKGGLTLVDTDGDGMPDWWEEAAGTNPLIADNNGDINGDGYTNLENYLNAIAPAGVPAATIDGIANDTGSSSSDGITNDGMLIFRGTAAPSAVVTLSRVDTGVIGTATADGTGHWTFDYTGTPLGPRYYAFIATVDLGSGKISPPTAAFVVHVVTAPASAPAITSIVLDPSAVLTGTAEPGSQISVALAGVGVVATATTDELGNWSAPYFGAPLAPGAYSFTATAVNLAGNAGPVSTAYLVDTSQAAPLFTGVSSDTGASATDRITNDTTLVFSGTSGPNATITVTRAGIGVIGITVADGGGTWIFDYTETILPRGTHTFTATASNSGNSSAASTPFVVTIDTTPPTISSIRRQEPSTSSTTSTTLVYRVTFAEPVAGVDLGNFTLSLSGTTAMLASLAPVSSTIYDVTVNGATGDGTVRLDLSSSGTSIVDVAGNNISGGYTLGQTYTIRLPGSGVWTSTESDELWSQATNWEAGIIATGAGATADFSSLDLMSDVTVQLDSPRTLERIVFGDTDFSTTGLWTLSNNHSLANTMTLSGSSPNIQVNGTMTTGDTVDVPAANGFPVKLDVALAGTAGFTKTGVGTILLTQPNSISGPLTISKGMVEVGPGGSLSPSLVTIAATQQLRISGGDFKTSGDVNWNSGTGTGIIVSGGTASFQKIIPSNGRNSFFKVSGGTVTATDISFLRSGDSRLQAIAAGILISGGDSTVGTIGLATGDSWGAMAISGGKLTVTGPLNVADQKTGGRGAVLTVSGGEFDVTDDSPAGGLIMSRNPGGSSANPSNVSEFTLTGGVSNVARLTLGYDDTVTAGSATVTLNDGELNLGSGGIVKNGTSGLASLITLTRGTMGAIAPWSTAHPMAIAGTPATLALRAANSTGTPFDIALNGVLSGTGGFAKTGAGTLTLAAANTFEGDLSIDAGSLAITGSLASGGSVAVNTGTTLVGTGTIAKSIALNNGGTISPGLPGANGVLQVNALVWNGGGKLAIDLGAASDQLALTGALTKGTSGAHEIVLAASSPPLAGSTYTIATFASTDLTMADLTYSGLSGSSGSFIISPTSIQFVITGGGPASAYETWADLYHLPSAQRGPTADFDGDGLPNLLEFALGLDPTKANGSGLATITVTVGAEQYPAMTYVRRTDLGGVVLNVQVSPALSFSPGLDSVLVSSTINADGTTTEVVRSTVPLSALPTQFFRLSATTP